MRSKRVKPKFITQTEGTINTVAIFDIAISHWFENHRPELKKARNKITTFNKKRLCEFVKFFDT